MAGVSHNNGQSKSFRPTSAKTTGLEQHYSVPMNGAGGMPPGIWQQPSDQQQQQ